MGFLHGVLDDVSEKQPYEAGKEYLNTLVKSTLKCNLNSGHDGFCKAFQMVTVNVNRYNQAVKTSNENIKEKMEKLQTEMQLFTKDAFKGILPKADENDFQKVLQAVDAVNRELDSCKNYAKVFTDGLNIDDKSVNDAVEELHSPLSVRVKDALRTVKQESERLSKLAENETNNFKSMEAQIIDVLKKHGTQINCEITKKVTELVDNVNKLIRDIKSLLDDIFKQLGNYVFELDKWIKKADEMVIDTMVKTTEIVEKKPGKENQEMITARAGQVKDWSYWLERYVTKLTELTSAVDEKVTALAGEFKDGEEESDRSIKGIFEHLQGKVKMIKNGVLGEGNLGGSTGIEPHWNSIKDAIPALVKQIYNEDDSKMPSGHVGNLVKYMNQYAEKYTEVAFGNSVHKWIEKILRDNKIVNDKIALYIDNNSRHFKNEVYVDTENFKIKDARIGAISAVIKDALKNDRGDKLWKINKTVKGATEDASIVHNVAYVKDVWQNFAKSLQNEIRPDPLAVGDNIAKRIAEVVQDVIGVKDPEGSGYYNGLLQDAIRCILVKLADFANGAVTEVQRLITDLNIGTNLQVAIIKTQQIDRTFGGSKDGIGIALRTMRDAIITLHSNLNTATGQPGNGKNLAKNVDEAIAAVKNQAAQLTVSDATAIAALSDGIKSHLSALTGEFVVAGKKVIEQLQKLKSDISLTNNGKGLRKIHKQLTELHGGAVTKALNATQKFLDNHASRLRNATVGDIKQQVEKEVDKTQNILITQARKQYVTTMKLLLQHFSEKVTKVLSPLPNLIEKDLDLGFKGFMNKIEKYFIGTDKGIKVIKDINTTHSPPEKSPLSQAAAKFIGSLIKFLHDLKKQPDFITDYEKIKPTRDALAKLCGDVITSQHFDHQFSRNVDALTEALSEFTPSEYGEAKCPSLLNALKAGFTPLVKELKKAYVSSYSGRQWREEELGHYAKICWTITPIVYQELTTLKHGLDIDGWDGNKIYNSTDHTSSLHALFFRDNGYDFHRPENAEHGELNHRNDFNGSSILKHLTKETHNLFSQLSSPITGIPRSTSGSDELGVTVAEESGVIRKLYDFLKTYFSVCHLTLVDKPRAPSSVYEILVWCCGLQFNPVYGKLKKHIESEFMKEDKLNPGTKTLQPFEAHPSRFEYTDVDDELYKVSSDSHAVLTAILGHGHKDGIYACEFSNNSLRLDYPTSMIQLLCTLFDLLKRLYHQLYFLLQQCRNDAQLSGWKDCHYGRYIGGSGWQCNTKQCPKQDCDQRHDQSGNQTGEQFPSCGIKSPLQSFLEDGLKGHLPHSLSARGSSLSCGTCGSAPGMPCRTPMGFADIGAVASHTMIGQNICEVLEYFCGRPNSPLTSLCSHFNCLMPSAPKTLADMFSFYYHLTDRWGMHGNDHKSDAFNATVRAANFGRAYDGLNVYHLFTPSHSALKKGHSDGSLGSLVCLSRDSVVCGPYLRPITHSIYETFSSKHADKYLSWVVYLTASFYDLLKKLYDECNSKCGSRGSNCHGKACIEGCPTTSKHDPPRYHDRKCKSIVSCNSTMPTLAKYGFVLGNPEKLHGDGQSHTKRTCRDFCAVFAEAFEKDSHLVQFFKAIDNFMFTIRQPFIWLNVALWSLSLFYLICVMVGRLDVLHIKSHLRSPSSHKITAQSLLAAAQVGRLAKISYLLP